MKKFPDFNMLIQRLKGVVDASPGQHHKPQQIPVGDGLSLNSRDEIRGKIFIALPGLRADGRDFMQQAFEGGAVAIICEAKGLGEQQHKSLMQFNIPWVSVQDLHLQLVDLADYFYDYPAKKLKLVGVTGTNGKTTICQLGAEIISRRVGHCALMGTLGNGLSGQLKTSTNTTSDVITIRKTMAAAVKAEAKHLLMEVSSHALHQGRVAGLKFEVVVLTNLSRDHLDYHPDLKSYGEVKRSLFVDYSAKFAVLNKDDAFARKLIADRAITARKVVYFIAEDRAESCCEEDILTVDGTRDFEEKKLPTTYDEVWASELKMLPDGQQFLLTTPWGKAVVSIKLLGKFNLSNVLAVVSLLGCLKFSWEEIVAEIPKVMAVPGRMEAFSQLDKPTVVVDYAHTPDALLKALTALRSHCRGRLWCVFGCGGDRDSGKRPQMAAAAEQIADKIIITDDNPRFENGDEIIAAILTGIKNPQRVVVIRDRYQAIAKAITHATPKDIILVAGKGHENYQLVAGETRSFSDREVVGSLLQEAARCG